MIKSKNPIRFISYSNQILNLKSKKFIKTIGVTENIKMKSSLKFCVVAIW